MSRSDWETKGSADPIGPRTGARRIRKTTRDASRTFASDPVRQRARDGCLFLFTQATPPHGRDDGCDGRGAEMRRPSGEYSRPAGTLNRTARPKKSRMPVSASAPCETPDWRGARHTPQKPPPVRHNDRPDPTSRSALPCWGWPARSRPAPGARPSSSQMPRRAGLRRADMSGTCPSQRRGSLTEGKDGYGGWGYVFLSAIKPLIGALTVLSVQARGLHPGECAR